MKYHQESLEKQKRIQYLKDQILFEEVAVLFKEKPEDEVEARIMKLKLEISSLHEQNN